MNSMTMPGFTGDASLYKTNRRYQSFVKTVRQLGGEQRVISQASVTKGGLGRVGARRLGFTCTPDGCACLGTDDCLDLLISTDLCGPVGINCTDAFGSTMCWCRRK